eukprot:TRINITY_DN84052_c0_g1_i1.p1 TRINITY_DN84052_c0_g1~~TRINITY_DN84052_c0_g1_i1.p1  ORF type:complete len:239 (-),score=35.92 TRINITY_DN84052_c0_g1_i1:210-926(-)
MAGKPSSRMPAALVGLMELLKLLDWFSDLLKVVCNEPAGRPYWTWVVFTLVMGSACVVQRMFDQLALIIRATDWGLGPKLTLACFTFPITVAMLPFHYVAASFYTEDLAEDHVQIFAQRPLSTFFLGMPFYSILSAFYSGPLAMHPVQAHFRAMQGMYQTALQDLPNIVVDTLVIEDNYLKGNPEDVTFFIVSLSISLLLTFVTMIVSVIEVEQIEGAGKEDKMSDVEHPVKMEKLQT